MKKMRKVFAALLAAAVSVTSLGTSVYASADDGTLVIARAYDAVGLDPGFLTENAQIVDNIFDRLVMRDEDLNLVSVIF